ncbi:hypothetical protein BKA66DRAFT_439544 [Pyrenochaeta sp. MPI-SDFR-AT-0127]|nr:hypothetical protein BKA66DRAFT_439544 [Pyrenochaeta sp. MPI-SDFR-AT-0127]
MSVRGPRGRRGYGHGYGRGRGRGRGRGGRTAVWEWESYTPGPEIYEQLWRIRKAPATVTPQLSSDCPIPNAQTRILDRRQTESETQQNFYKVEITRPSTHRSSNDQADEVTQSKEVEEVDLSCILQYVSPHELERFENEQFRIEAEAEAEVLRQEAQELARRRLEKNARIPRLDKGGRTLTGLGLNAEAPRRGRPRGRGRGRGRGSWQKRGALVMHSQLQGDTREDVAHAESIDQTTGVLHREEEELQRIIAETETETDEEDSADVEGPALASPTIMRSAFFTNSALAVSPITKHRRLSNMSMMQHAHSEVPETDDSENDYNAQSISSIPMQFPFEDKSQGETDDELGEDNKDDGHRSKRRRTESTSSNQRAQMQSIPEPRLTTVSMSPFEHRSSTLAPDEPLGEENGVAEEDAEEYAVEGILEHFHEGGRDYFLVKWEGYDEAYDWLPEEDLEGAGELVAEYREQFRGGKKKSKSRMT